ncbi:MAG TPA: hypothetical protein V6D17_14670 [Candidatus Obscuribacterales bacterium]
MLMESEFVRVAGQHHPDTGDVRQRSFSVLIGDRDMFFRNWLKEHLRRSFPCIVHVHEAADAHGTVQRARERKPDIIYLSADHGEASMDVVTIAEQIWDSHRRAAVLIISSNTSESRMRSLLSVKPPEAKVGWLTRSDVVEKMSMATECFLKGDCRFDEETSRLPGGQGRDDWILTDTEYTALIFIALGLSDRTTAAVCCITQQAVQARLRSLYQKLRIPPTRTRNSPPYNPRCRAVWLALQHGILTEQELRLRAAEIRREAERRGVDIDP